MELFTRIDTTGFYNSKKPFDDPSQPEIIRLQFQLTDGVVDFHTGDFILYTYKDINKEAEKVHGISSKMSGRFGLDAGLVFNIFASCVERANNIISHNVKFLSDFLFAEMYDSYNDKIYDKIILNKCHYCTMKSGVEVCKIKNKSGKYRWPSLQELHKHLFGHIEPNQLKAIRNCYYKMIDDGGK